MCLGVFRLECVYSIKVLFMPLVVKKISPVLALYCGISSRLISMRTEIVPEYFHQLANRSQQPLYCSITGMEIKSTPMITSNFTC